MCEQWNDEMNEMKGKHMSDCTHPHQTGCLWVLPSPGWRHLLAHPWDITQKSNIRLCKISCLYIFLVFGSHALCCCFWTPENMFEMMVELFNFWCLADRALKNSQLCLVWNLFSKWCTNIACIYCKESPLVKAQCLGFLKICVVGHLIHTGISCLNKNGPLLLPFKVWSLKLYLQPTHQANFNEINEYNINFKQNNLIFTSKPSSELDIRLDQWCQVHIDINLTVRRVHLMITQKCLWGKRHNDVTLRVRQLKQWGRKRRRKTFHLMHNPPTQHPLA